MGSAMRFLLLLGISVVFFSKVVFLDDQNGADYQGGRRDYPVKGGGFIPGKICTSTIECCTTPSDCAMIGTCNAGRCMSHGEDYAVNCRTSKDCGWGGHCVAGHCTIGGGGHDPFLQGKGGKNGYLQGKGGKNGYLQGKGGKNGVNPGEACTSKIDCGFYGSCVDGQCQFQMGYLQGKGGKNGYLQGKGGKNGVFPAFGRFVSCRTSKDCGGAEAGGCVAGHCRGIGILPPPATWAPWRMMTPPPRRVTLDQNGVHTYTLPPTTTGGSMEEVEDYQSDYQDCSTHQDCPYENGCCIEGQCRPRCF